MSLSYNSRPVNKYRKRKYTKRTSALAVARIADKKASMALGAIEVKDWQRFENVPNGINWLATAVSLNAIPQGTTSSSRIGDRIKCLRLRMQFQANSADAITPYLMRITVVQDKQANVTGSLLYQYPNTQYSCMSPFLYDYRKRFNVVYDKVVKVNPGTNNDAVFWKINKKLRFSTIFNNETGTIVTNALNMYISTDVNPATDALLQPGYKYTSELLYADA